ncbi:MAG: hypothetical protein OEX83_00625 [Gammaproteobacteria bacterium]|nr:hypothetical protein [Gammaproteobacteria bacterium]
MNKFQTKKPLAIAIGSAFVASLAASPMVNAEQNPFSMNELSSGYQVADSGKMEGNCGSKHKEKSDGNCGGKMNKEKMHEEDEDEHKSKKMEEGEGKCGAKKKAVKEGQCGEAKCGGMKKEKKAKEGNCGGMQ